MIYTPAANIVTIIVLALAAAFVGRKFDPDVGGYADGWFTTATFPDKIIHMAFGALLTFVLMQLMKPELAVVGTIAIGLLYEIGQGYISWFDWFADMWGALIVYGYILLTS